MNKLKKIKRRSVCVGCGLCTVGTNSGMTSSTRGFLIPDSENIDPNWEKYCPAVRLTQPPINNHDDVIYGPTVMPVLVGHAVEEKINFGGASGGVITALLIFLLENKQIDGVWQIGASLSKPSENQSYYNTTREDILNCMGSRYSQGALFSGFEEILNSTKKVAVVGRPCDIAGLKQYLQVYPKYKKNIVFTFSFMCMGVPSQNATAKLHNTLSNNLEIKTIKYRGHGWPGRAAAFDDKGNETGSLSYIESWGAILGRDILFRCKVCPDGFGGFADISAGDAWFYEKGKPVFDSDHLGRSLIFIRTESGKELIQNAINSGFVKTEVYNMNELPKIQLSQYTRKINLPTRYLLYKFLIYYQISFKDFKMIRLFFSNNFKNMLKDSRGFLGRYWRDYKKMARRKK